jgi:hypothetical protein
VKLPASATPTSVRVSTVAVTLLKADSAITVWDTLGGSFKRSKRGMRMAGSVAARTAPMSRATGKATPNTGQTTSATITAVMSTPGRTSNPRPTAVREIPRKEMPVPPWKRMRATPMLKRSWAPTPIQGVLDDPEHGRPDQSPRRDEHDHLGNLYERRYELGEESGSEYEAEIPEDELYFHP